MLKLGLPFQTLECFKVEVFQSIEPSNVGVKKKLIYYLIFQYYHHHDDHALKYGLFAFAKPSSDEIYELLFTLTPVNDLALQWMLVDKTAH